MNKQKSVEIRMSTRQSEPPMSDVYKLKISIVKRTCLFELTWGRGKQLTAQLPYPDQLENLYVDWKQLYLSYYQSLPDESVTFAPEAFGSVEGATMRGQVVASGQVMAKANWQGQLVQSETTLLYEFHQWLRSAALFDIRSALGQRVVNVQQGQQQEAPIELLITCEGFLSRLPWEAWEINAEFRSTKPIRLTRLPLNINEDVTPPFPLNTRARVLVILGDDTGLNFSAELKAISQLKGLVDLAIIEWHPGKDTEKLKHEICDNIQSEPGWDMLLFFGHSNEANAVGGQISIAPHTTLSIRELTPFLQRAKANGLRFALFNSCEGIDIAASLIDLGLNQVAIMREPIHNRVAQVFLIQFMQGLARFEDVHTALQKANDSLRTESNLTYPSAHLIPSLFRHNNAVLFRLQPIGWKRRLRSLSPCKQWQTAALVVLTGLSLVAPVTELLLSHRLWAQAGYRDLLQSPPSRSTPPVLLIQIDDEALRKDISSGIPNPMDRIYLAKIVNKLSELEVSVVGIDYLLDRPQANNDPLFADSIRTATAGGTSFVISTELKNGNEVDIHPNVASLNWVMQGYANSPRWYIRMLQEGYECGDRCPFAYLLSLTHLARKSSISQNIVPNLESKEDLRLSLLDSLANQERSVALNRLYQKRLPIFASLSRWWNQRWLHPVLDFSLPPEEIYDQIGSHQFLKASPEQLFAQFDVRSQVIIVASGGYDEAGIGGAHQDYLDPPPPAIHYWYKQQGIVSGRFTGGEVNAYGVHHFLNQHYVTPLPDSWLVGVTIILSFGILFAIHRYQRSRQEQVFTLVVLSSTYGWMTLHLYLVSQILLPWLLPTAALWIFCLPSVLTTSSKHFS